MTTQQVTSEERADWFIMADSWGPDQHGVNESRMAWMLMRASAEVDRLARIVHGVQIVANDHSMCRPGQSCTIHSDLNFVLSDRYLRDGGAE